MTPELGTAFEQPELETATAQPARAKRRRLRFKQPELAIATPSLGPGPRQHRRDLRGAYIGVDGQTFRSLQRLGMPIVLYRILHDLTGMRDLVQHQDLDFVEFFSGQGHLHRSVRSLGLKATGYDLKQDAVLQNIMTVQGFITAVQWCRRVRAGGHCHFGTVCSSWVWMCRATTRRSESCPLGDRRAPRHRQ